MEGLFPILLLLWAVYSLVMKQSQKKKKEEAARAARENAEAARASQGVPQQQRAAAPASPYYDDRSAPQPQQPGQGSMKPPAHAEGAPYYAQPARPQQPPVQPKFDPQTGARLSPNAQAASRQMQQPPTSRQAPPPAARQAAPLQSRAQSNMVSTLTDIAQRRHPLEVSERTGHAHQETSMTGAQACPPVQGSVKPAAPHAAPVPAFYWDQNAVLSGLVYAEILRPPKALRRR